MIRGSISSAPGDDAKAKLPWQRGEGLELAWNAAPSAEAVINGNLIVTNDF